MDLVALCASHMNSKQRWDMFVYMIDSWNCQKVPIQLFVSMSFDSAIGNGLLEDIESMRSGYPRLEILLSDKKMSQFEHYKKLANYVSEKKQDLHNKKDTWVIFTDDDDIWHPLRSYEYSKGMEFMEMAEAFGQDITNIMYILLHSIVPGEEGDLMKTWKDVETIKHRFEESNIPEPCHLGNYVEYSTKLRTLHNFTQDCPSNILQHKFCDMGFVRYLRTEEKPVMKYPTENWSYYYRLSKTIGQVCQDNQSLPVMLKNNIELSWLSYGKCTIKMMDILQFGTGGQSMPKMYHTMFKKYSKQLEYLSKIPKWRD